MKKILRKFAILQDRGARLTQQIFRRGKAASGKGCRGCSRLAAVTAAAVLATIACGYGGTAAAQSILKMKAHNATNTSLNLQIETDANTVQPEFYCAKIVVTSGWQLIRNIGGYSVEASNTAFNSNQTPTRNAYYVRATLGGNLSKIDNFRVEIVPGADGEVVFSLVNQTERPNNTLCAQTPSRYSLHSNEHTVTHTFAGGTPTVSISSGAGNIDSSTGTDVTEGYLFDFTVSRTGLSTTDLTVSITPTVTGTGNSKITLLHGETTLTDGTAFDVIIPAFRTVSAPQRIFVTGDVDSTDDVDISLALTAPSPDTYTNGTANQVLVDVKDSDVTPTAELPLVSLKAAGQIHKGEEVLVHVVALPLPKNQLRVNLEITPSGNFVDDRHVGIQQVTVNPNSANSFFFTGTHRIRTISEEVSEDETIAVRLLDGNGYRLPKLVSDSMTSVTVLATARSEQLPIVTIDRYESEGGSAVASAAVHEGDRFKVTINVTLPSGFTGATPTFPVTLNVSQTGGDFVSTGNSEHFVSNARISPIYFNTIDDDVAEENGLVTVSIVDSPLYHVSETHANYRRWHIPVLDNDHAATPSFTVSAGPSILEGEYATFTLTASEVPSSALTVNFDIRQDKATANGPASFLAFNSNTAYAATVEPSATMTKDTATNTILDCYRLSIDRTCRISIPTVADGTKENNSEIILRIKSDVSDPPTYGVGAAREASVNVVDDDIEGVPSVGVTVDMPTVMETDADQMVTFTLEATGGTELPDSLDVWIQVADAELGDFIASSAEGVQIVTLSKTGEMLKADHVVTIVGDTAFDPAGQVSVQVLPDSRDTQLYAPGNSAIAATTVTDNETPHELSLYVGTSGTLTHSLAEAETAEVTLASSKTESLDDIGLLTTSNPPGCIAQYFDSAAITSGSSAALSLAVADVDTIYRGNCIATVTLQTDPGRRYTLKSGESTVTVTFTDDDTVPTAPTFSIKNVTQSEAAGEMVFTVLLFPALADGLTATVDYEFSLGTATNEDFTTLPVDGTLTFVGGTVSEAALVDGITLGEIRVPFLDDVLDEADETFIVGLSNAVLTEGTGTAPEISGDYAIATGTIVDDDPEPIVTVPPAVTANESEGMIAFPVSLNVVSGRDVTVAYAFVADDAVVADFAGGDPSGMLTIAAGSTTGSIDLPLANDGFGGEDAEDFSLSLTLTNAVFADATNTGSVTGTITDLPEISITSNNPNYLAANAVTGVTEGYAFNYTLARTVSTGGELQNVMVNVKATGRGISELMLENGTGGAITNDVPFAVTIPADMNYTGTVTVKGNARPGVVVSVSLNGSPTTYFIDPEAVSVSVEVKDNDATSAGTPRLSIEAPTAAVRADHSADAVFRITTPAAPSPAKEVRYVVTHTGSLLGSLESLGTDAEVGDVLTIDTTGAATELRIPTSDPDDSADNDDGTVTVTLLDGAGYTLADVNTATATIIDDKQGTVFSMTGAHRNSIVADSVTLTLSRETDAAAQHCFGFEVVGNHQIITSLTSSNQVEGTGPGNSTNPAVFSLALEFDENDRDAVVTAAIQNVDGSLSFTLLDGADPKISCTYSAADMANGIESGDAWDAGSVYQVGTGGTYPATGRVIFTDNVPVISIADAVSDVAEADDAAAVFVLTADVSETTAVPVRWTPKEVEDGDFLASTVENVTVDHGAEDATPLSFTDPDGDGIFTAEISVPIENDRTAEATGKIMVQLDPDDDTPAIYTVSTVSGADSAEATVWDDDRPVLAITGGGRYLEADNEMAEFTVTARATPRISKITVRITPSVIPANLLGSPWVSETTGSQELTFAGQSEVKFTVPLADNGTKDGDTVLAVMLEPAAGDPADAAYAVSSVAGENTATVTVVDDDLLPTVSIADLTGVAETAGAEAVFVVTANVTSATGIPLRYTPSEESDSNFLASTVKDVMVDHGADDATPLLFADTDGDGVFTAEIKVPIDNDDVAEDTGTITVTLAEDDESIPEYLIAAESSTASANVWDDERPVLSIEGLGTVKESDDAVARFRVTSLAPPSAATVPALITPTVTPANLLETLKSGEIADLDLAFSGGTTVDFMVKLEGNDDDDGNATLEIVLESDNEGTIDYNVGTQNTGTVTILDDETVPVVSISDAAAGVAESAGAMAVFVLTAEVIEDTAIPVRWTPMESGGDFLESTVEDVTVDSADDAPLNFTDTDGDGVFTTEIMVPIHNDSDREATGMISVMLADDEEPAAYAVATDSSTAMATVWDDDRPVLAIEGGGRFAEADTDGAVFTVKSLAPPSAETVTVRVTPSASPTNVLGNPAESGVEKDVGLMFGGTDSATFTIDLQDNDTKDEDATLTVMLGDDTAADATYAVSAESGSNTAMATIVDDEALPVISIADSADVVEGNNAMAEFELTADVSGAITIPVRYTPSEVSGDFLTAAVDDTVVDGPIEFRISAEGDYTATIMVPIENDAIPEDTGSIMVTLNQDNDSPAEYLVSETAGTAMARVWDDDRPILSIAAESSVVEEGEDAVATFTVTSLYPPSAETVEIRITPTIAPADLLKNLTSGETVTRDLMFENTTTATFTILLADNASMDGHTTLAVVLADDDTTTATYAVNTETGANMAAVRVIDDDTLPVVSIADSVGVAEAANAEAVFILTADLIAPGSIPVRWTPAESGGDYLDSEVEGVTVDSAGTVPLAFEDLDGDGIYTAEIRVPIHSDATREDTGKISVMLEDDIDPAAYTVATDSGVATATVWDDDRPVLSVEGGGRFAEADSEKATFTVRSLARPSTSTVTVRITPSVSPTSVLATPAESDMEKDVDLMFGNANTATFAIDLKGNNSKDGDAILTVVLGDDDETDATYAVSPVSGENTAMVTIVDDESLPVVSIANSAGVGEGDNAVAEFVLTADVSEATTIHVRYTPSEVSSGDFLADSVEDSVVDGPVQFSMSDNGDYTATIMVPIENNTDSEDTGSIMVTLNQDNDSPAEYKVSETAGTATAPVWDDDRPILSISGEPSVTEGTDAVATFTITSRASPSAETVTVRITPTIDRTSLLENLTSGETVTRELMFGSTKTANFTILLEGNETSDGHATLAVVLEADDMDTATYTVSTEAGANMAAVTIIDDESLPIVSIADTTVAEADNAEAVFVLTADLTTPAAIPVRWTPMESGGDFLESTVEGVTVDSADTAPLMFADSNGDGVYTAEIRVPIHNDAIREATGMISVMLEDDESPAAYSVASDPGASSATATVWDDDLPVLSVQGGDSVTESDTAVAMFTVTSLAAPSAASVTIRITPKINPANLLRSSSVADMIETRTLTFTGATASFSIPVGDNTTNDGHATLTVALEDDDADPATYTVGDVPTTAVTVFDDESTDELVVITAVSVAPIEEGQEAVFRIRSSRSESSINVGISVAQDRNHIFTPIPQEVSLVSSEFELRIPTLDNREIDPNKGSITATLIAGSGYEIPATDKVGRSATVVVNDNDGASAGNRQQYSVVESVITSILMQIPATAAPPQEPESFPTISITAESSHIEEGSDALFILNASKTSLANITVKVNLTEKGDFLNGVTEAYGLIESGNSSGLLAVATVDDNVAEPDGTIQARIKEGDKYAAGANDTATIVVSDAHDRQVRQNLLDEANLTAMSQAVGSFASASLNMAAHRTIQALSASSGFSVELGGNSTMAEILHAGVNFANQGTQSWEKILGDSSFEIGLFPEEGRSNLATIWGLGDRWSLNNGETLDGHAYTGHFGFDASLDQGAVAGLGTSFSQSEMEYANGNNIISYQTRSTGVHPYVGFESSDGNRLQLTAGYGLGEIELDQGGYATEILDSSIFNFGIGGEMKLYSSESILKGGSTQLIINGESWTASQFVKGRSDAASDLRSDGRHLRVLAVGTHQHNLEHGAKLTPEVSFGLRQDGMMRQSYFGLEMAGGLGYKDQNGFNVSSKGEILLSGTNHIQKWGVSSQLTFDSFADRLGITAKLTPSWSGNDATSDSVLWNHSILSHEFGSGTLVNGAGMDAEIGYGISVWDRTGVLHTYSKANLSQFAENEFGIGSKLSVGSDFEFELEGLRSYQKDGIKGRDISFAATVKW